MRERRTVGAEQSADMSGEGTDRQGLSDPERRDRTHPPACRSTAARRHCPQSQCRKVDCSPTADDAKGHRARASRSNPAFGASRRKFSRATVDTKHSVSRINDSACGRGLPSGGRIHSGRCIDRVAARAKRVDVSRETRAVRQCSMISSGLYLSAGPAPLVRSSWGAGSSEASIGLARPNRDESPSHRGQQTVWAADRQVRMRAAV